MPNRRVKSSQKEGRLRPVYEMLEGRIFDLAAVGPRRPDAIERVPVEQRQEAVETKDVSNASGARGEVPQKDVVENAEGSAVKSKAAIYSLMASRLDLDKDEATGQVIYRFVDRQTGEVIRQLPEEEMLRELKAAGPTENGSFVDKKA